MLQQSTLSYFIFDIDKNSIEIKSERIKGISNNQEMCSSCFSFKSPHGRFKFGILAHWGSLISDFKSLENQSLDLSTFNYEFNGLEITNNPESFVLRVVDHTSQNSIGQAAISLKRLNSVLQILITDEIPKNIGYILFGGKLPSKIYPFESGKFQYDDSKYLLFKVISFIGKSENMLHSIIYAGDHDEDYEIRAYDFNNQMVLSKKIPKVRFKENHITRLTGKLFDQTEQVTFKIQFLNEYANDIIKVNY